MATRVEIINDFLAINVNVENTIQRTAEVSGSTLNFGCRSGECGLCIVEIEQGKEFLSEIELQEKETLEEMNKCDKSKNYRLACQMKITKPNGLIRIRN